MFNFQASLQLLKILPKIFSTFLPMHPVSSLTLPIMISQPYPRVQIAEDNREMLIDPYTLSILNYQNYLNLELLKNQNLISSYLNIRKQDQKLKNISQTSGSSSNSETIQNQISYSPYFQTIINLQTIRNQPKHENVHSDISPAHQHQKNIKKCKKAQDSDYQPERSDSQNYKLGKSSESKNVPKNFSKAILLFIKHKQNHIKKLVEQEGSNWQQFIELVNHLKGKINSIAQLRSLWLESQNKYARIFRIISNLYLKRFSLQHIFNSRVQDHCKHLKYRNKISQVLKNPQQFTRMKDY